MRQSESVIQSFRGYFRVFRDGAFLLFMLASVLAWMTYMNMNTTLGVFLRDVHGIPASGYGYIISLNAIIVVLFQFWTTRRLEKYPPMLIMALGTLLFAVGFAMYGLFSSYVWFMLAMVIITVGEIVAIPVANAEVINFAPEDMRGRYGAVYGISWMLPSAIGPYLAGLLMDNYNPNLLWYACGACGMLATVGFLVLHRSRTPDPSKVPVAEQQPA